MSRAKELSIAWALVLVLMPLMAVAGAPQMINYQGRLTDDQGQPVNGAVSMTFTIYDDETVGDSKWTETHPSVSVVDGLFSVILGAGDPPSPIEDTVFSDDERWLEITVGGETVTPRTRLVSVGYAHRVSTVDGASGGVIAGSFVVTPDTRADLPNDFAHAGTPLVEIGTACAINPSPTGRSGSLHLLDGTGTPVIDLDGQTSSVGIGTTSMDANLYVNGDIYTYGGDGDITLNQVVNVEDITTYINYLYMGAIINAEQYANADIDGDGRVTSDDVAILMLMIYNGFTRYAAIQRIHGCYGASPASSPTIDAFYIRGDLGIGTNSPLTKLQISWATNVDAEIGRGSSDPDITYIGLRNANGTKCYIYPNAAGNGIVVSTTAP